MTPDIVEQVLNLATSRGKKDRWWIIALCAAVAVSGLAGLVWNFPTAKWVWIFTAAVLVFVVVMYLNPRYRYWRRANICFGMAVGLAFTPAFVVQANLQKIGAFEVASESSPVGILGFIGAGVFLSWLDSRGQFNSSTSSCGTTTTSINTANSPQAISRITSGRDTIIHQGVTEETLLAIINADRRDRHLHEGSLSRVDRVDEALMWQVIDDVKNARRRFE